MTLNSIGAGFMMCWIACGWAIAQNQPNQNPPASGNTSRQQSQPAPPPVSAPPDPAQAFQQNGGSLLRATLSTQNNPGNAPLSAVSFFAVPDPEPRTLKKHDLVTIIVREVSSYSSDGDVEFNKEAEVGATIEEFIDLNALFTEFQLKGGGVTPPVPSIRMTGTRELEGNGSIERDDSLILRVTAEVVDVKPNGTLVLQARQRIVTDDEQQEFILSGFCRAEDVTPDNTILSTQLFDKEITKSHKGTVREATKRGWLSKLLDVISPF